jgi:phosphoribosylformylglycinamidine synthase
VGRALVANDQIALKYAACADGAPGVEGETVREGPAGYPACPSGSWQDTAGVIDPTGRILGLMPHPERDQDPWLRPGFAREQALRQPPPPHSPPPAPRATGMDLFRAAVEHLRSRATAAVGREGSS